MARSPSTGAFGGSAAQKPRPGSASGRVETSGVLTRAQPQRRVGARHSRRPRALESVLARRPAKAPLRQGPAAFHPRPPPCDSGYRALSRLEKRLIPRPHRGETLPPQVSVTALAHAFLDFQRLIAPTQWVILKGDDPRLSAPLRALRADVVIVGPNFVETRKPSKLFSSQYLLVQSGTDSNLWTLHRHKAFAQWLPLGDSHQILVITNQ